MWSHAFSHLVLMGGVKFHTSTAPDAAGAVLFTSDIITFTKRGWTRCEELSTAAVEDKSKANGFNKAVASIQIFWFFSQLLGRLASNIVISPLEWFTLAYVVCAFAMYGFWWHKPFDVQTPLLIYADLSLSAEQMSTLKVCVSAMDEGLNRVPMLYISSNTPIIIAMAIATVLFGACHLFGWNYPFPTTFETYMWRSASVFCVCIPLAVLVIQWTRRYPSGLPDWFLPGIMTALLFLYVPVRLFLLFEVFFALRSAPQEIYKAVPWAQHIPHI